MSYNKTKKKGLSGKMKRKILIWIIVLIVLSFILSGMIFYDSFDLFEVGVPIPAGELFLPLNNTMWEQGEDIGYWIVLGKFFLTVIFSFLIFLPGVQRAFYEKQRSGIKIAAVLAALASATVFIPKANSIFLNGMVGCGPLLLLALLFFVSRENKFDNRFLGLLVWTMAILATLVSFFLHYYGAIWYIEESCLDGGTGVCLFLFEIVLSIFFSVLMHCGERIENSLRFNAAMLLLEPIFCFLPILIALWLDFVAFLISCILWVIGAAIILILILRPGSGKEEYSVTKEGNKYTVEKK